MPVVVMGFSFQGAEVFSSMGVFKLDGGCRQIWRAGCYHGSGGLPPPSFTVRSVQQVAVGELHAGGRMHSKSVDLRPLVEGLMGDFFDPGDVNWRQVLEGEELQLAATVGDVEAETLHVTFQDGVRLVGPVGPFDAIACAQVLLQVQEGKDAKPQRRHR